MKTKNNTDSFDPYRNLVLDKYEKSIEKSLKEDEWVSIMTPERREELRQAAKDTLELRKSKKITVRINQGDLIKLKARAEEKNIPYQTLLGVLVRDFVDRKYTVKL
jgi:predicted DNA binding CopG/RHH family protein